MGARWYFQFLRSDLVSPMFNLSANAGFVASPVSILPHPPASGVGPLYRISFIGFPPANPLTVYQKLMAASKAAAIQNVLIPYMCSNEANPYEWPLDRRLLNAPLLLSQCAIASAMGRVGGHVWILSMSLVTWGPIPIDGFQVG